MKSIEIAELAGRAVKRVRLPFALGVVIEFVDRERALKQVYELAEKGTRLPLVVFGPEGCGKTAWLLQAAEVFRELGFGVLYINPLRRRFEVEVGVEDLRRKALELVKEALSEHALARLAWRVVDFAREAIELGRRKLAVVVDDAFQYTGAREAALIVKSLLELIEYPPKSYDVIVATAATSEGISRAEIGRHLWAWVKPMWNMPKKGFEELCEKVPGEKPALDQLWKLTGGNPRLLAQLYEAKWDVEAVVRGLAEARKLDTFVHALSSEEKELLLKAIEDPDALATRDGLPLLSKLVELNLVVDSIPSRDPRSWIDEPPPERDLELGVGRYVAWQTPLHKEVVKVALREL